MNRNMTAKGVKFIVPDKEYLSFFSTQKNLGTQHLGEALLMSNNKINVFVE